MLKINIELKAIIPKPLARPSIPSIKLKEFIIITKTKIDNEIDKK